MCLYHGDHIDPSKLPTHSQLGLPEFLNISFVLIFFLFGCLKLLIQFLLQRSSSVNGNATKKQRLEVSHFVTLLLFNCIERVL